MDRVIILQGGEDVKARNNYSLFKQILSLSDSRKILIIPWTTRDLVKEFKYRSILEKYFKDVGFRDVLFLEKSDSFENVYEKFRSVDVVYLPGGDPKILYEEITSRPYLIKLLKDFKGILVGNSAGAVVLSKGSPVEEWKGLGLVEFQVVVHCNLGNLPSNVVCLSLIHI